MRHKSWTYKWLTVDYSPYGDDSLQQLSTERLISRPVKTTMPPNLPKYTCIQIFTFKYLHSNIYIKLFTFKYLHSNIYIQIFTFKYLHSNICIQIFTFKYLLLNIYFQIFTFKYLHQQTHKHSLHQLPKERLISRPVKNTMPHNLRKYTCIQIFRFRYTCNQTFTFRYTPIQIFTYISRNSQTYSWRCSCIYTCLHINLNF